VASGHHISGYPLPREVASAVAGTRASNFGLLFHRLLRYPQEWRMEGEEKNRVWRAQVFDRAREIFAQMPELLSGLHKRLDHIADGLSNEGFNVLKPPLQMHVDWRLAIGFSSASVLDTGIALHRIYGIPYIPATAVKGLTRYFRLAKIAEELGVPVLDPEAIKQRRRQERKTPWEMLEELLVAEEPKDERSRQELQRRLRGLQEDRAVQQVNKPDGVRELTLHQFQTEYATSFRRAFGSTARRGEVIFFDVFPEQLMVTQNGRNEPILELDIINTHYQAYYTGTPPAPPADYLSPIPVYFLTVRAGTPFRFRLAAKDQTLLDTVVGWLKEALQKFGIGAKTMAGYGAMSPT
jgi:CRISPR-associated protein Cmr6